MSKRQGTHLRFKRLNSERQVRQFGLSLSGTHFDLGICEGAPREGVSGECDAKCVCVRVCAHVCCVCVCVCVRVWRCVEVCAFAHASQAPLQVSMRCAKRTGDSPAVRTTDLAASVSVSNLMTAREVHGWHKRSSVGGRHSTEGQKGSRRGLRTIVGTEASVSRSSPIFGRYVC